VSRLIETTSGLWTTMIKGLPIGYFRQVPVRPRQYEQPPILETL
jgi:hypothetical protein